MSRHSIAFITAALIYLVIGMTLGLVMAFEPALIWRLRPAHAHVNLLGWVSMFIFGVAYHVVPTFTGQPLHSSRLADFHVVAANIGLIGMATTIAILGPGPVFGAFGALETLGGLAFVYNILRTVAALARAGRLRSTAKAGPGEPPAGLARPGPGH